MLSASVAPRLGRSSIVLFDVRERDEYGQSHMPGAIHVEPDMEAKDFLAQHEARLDARAVVFYGSVGVRSGRMVERLAGAISPSLPAAAFNLRGGIFRWFVAGPAAAFRRRPGNDGPPL